MYYTSIAKITFRRMTSLIKFIMAESPAMLDHIDPSLVNVSNVGVLATQPSIVILQPLPSSVQPSHGHSNCPEQSRVCQFVALIMYFIGAVLHTSLYVLRFKFGLTLHKTWWVASQQGFSLALYSNVVFHSAPSLSPQDVSTSPLVSLLPTPYIPISTPSLS